MLFQSELIRIHAKPGGLLHFKFIKPHFQAFIEQRIDRNEDWDNSAEYRAYRDAMGTGGNPLVFYDDGFSKKTDQRRKRRQLSVTA